MSNLNANADNNGLDHYMGMTVETNFRQPIDGKVGSNNMTFEFAGDDDVWVYLDDALAIDLGGVHAELFGTIDFSKMCIRDRPMCSWRNSFPRSRLPISSRRARAILR